MNRLNTIFLGVIATVLVGAAVVWWLGQPSAAERRAAETRAAMDRAVESVERAVDLSR